MAAALHRPSLQPGENVALESAEEQNRERAYGDSQGSHRRATAVPKNVSVSNA